MIPSKVKIEAPCAPVLVNETNMNFKFDSQNFSHLLKGPDEESTLRPFWIWFFLVLTGSSLDRTFI